LIIPFFWDDTALLGKQFPLFQRNVMPSCSGVRISRRSNWNRIFNRSNVENSGLTAVWFVSYILVLPHSLSDLKVTHIVNNGFAGHMSITQYNSLWEGGGGAPTFLVFLKKKNGGIGG